MKKIHGKKRRRYDRGTKAKTNWSCVVWDGITITVAKIARVVEDSVHGARQLSSHPGWRRVSKRSRYS